MSVAQKLSHSVNPDVRYKLFEYGLEYYFIARVSAYARLSHIFGNLYHHAVEMMLKSHFCRTKSLHVIFKEYGHHLASLWKDFKADFSDKDLSCFDLLIADLDAFEKVRYPDHLLEHGGAIIIEWEDPPGKPQQSLRNKAVPEYRLTVRNIDRFVARLVQLLSINAAAFTTMVHHECRDVVLRDNPEASAWFSSQK
jgi:hypothetical protein